MGILKDMHFYSNINALLFYNELFYNELFYSYDCDVVVCIQNIAQNIGGKKSTFFPAKQQFAVNKVKMEK